MAERCPRMFLRSWAALWPSEKASLLPQLAVLLNSLGHRAAVSARLPDLPGVRDSTGTHAAPAGCPLPPTHQGAGCCSRRTVVFCLCAPEQWSRSAGKAELFPFFICIQ